MTHHENCACQACQHWFLAMQSFLARGRCHCGAPLDDHKMTTKGEVVSCPEKQRVA